MDCVERLKEGVEEILSGAGTLETLSQMQERVCKIAAGSVPWHLTEKQLNAELFDVLRKVWNFSLGLEKTTKKPERGEYFGMLRYFCVGVVLYLVVERGVNEDTDGEGEGVSEFGLGYEDDTGTEAKMKALTIFQLLRMTLHTGKVCMECVPDPEKAQFCFKIVIQQYSKIRDGGSPEEAQIILREIIRILYSGGKIFQSDVDDQEDLKGLLLAASVLSKDCPEEGSCFAALCLRNGVRLAGMSRYRKAAVWLTAATRNAHFLDNDSQALAFRRLAQVYFEWGAIDDFPDVIADLDKANSLVYHPTGALLKLKIVLASKPLKDPLDGEIEELLVDLLDRVDIGSLELIISELKNFGFHSAANFALDHVLAKSVQEGKETQHLFSLHLLRVNISLAEETQNQTEHPRLQQQLRHYHQQIRREFYRFLTDKTNHPFLDGLRLAKGRKLSSKLHSTIWNLAKNCLGRGEFQESIDWYRASLIFLETTSSAYPSSGTTSVSSSRSQTRVEAKLRRNLAKCFVELGDFAAADVQVEASLTLDPSCLLSLYRSFTVRLHSGRGLDETMQAFELLFVRADRVKEGGGRTADKELSSKEEEDSINVESVVSLALDEAFKSSRMDVIEAVIEKSLSESARILLSSQTILVVLRRALLLVFEEGDERAMAKRIEYLKMAFDILKGDIQKSGESDAGLRQTMLSEVDWFTPMAWNTIVSHDSVSSLDHFLLTFKFLALKEVKIRESLDLEERSEKSGEISDEKAEGEEERLKRESTASLLHVNLDMQDQMLGSAVDAGLRKIRSLRSTSGDLASPSTSLDKETIEEVLEMLFKVCEKRRRVLSELESFAGASESLLNCKLMAAIYHFEVCAKSCRHSHMSTLLAEIATLASMTEESIPSFTIFESLVDFCVEPPADHRLNYLVVCDCFVLAMKARAASAAKRSTSSSPRPGAVSTAVNTMPKLFADALDFVAGIATFNEGERTVVADRFSACFCQYLSNTTSYASSTSYPSAPALENEPSCALATLASKSLDLGLKCQKEAEDDAANKWSRLALSLARKGGAKELQMKIVAQFENVVAQKR